MFKFIETYCLEIFKDTPSEYEHFDYILTQLSNWQALSASLMHQMNHRSVNLLLLKFIEKGMHGTVPLMSNHHMDKRQFYQINKQFVRKMEKHLGVFQQF